MDAASPRQSSFPMLQACNMQLQLQLQLQLHTVTFQRPHVAGLQHAAGPLLHGPHQRRAGFLANCLYTGLENLALSQKGF